MSKIRNEATRIETIAMLEAVETAVAGFGGVFQEVATGVPLDPQRAENLAAQCAELRKGLIETRNMIQLSAETPGVH